MYRNSRRQVQRFLTENHGEHFKVYNFCSETGRKYESYYYCVSCTCIVWSFIRFLVCKPGTQQRNSTAALNISPLKTTTSQHSIKCESRHQYYSLILSWPNMSNGCFTSVVYHISLLFCEDAGSWLDANLSHVAVLHCKVLRSIFQLEYPV